MNLWYNFFMFLFFCVLSYLSIERLLGGVSRHVSAMTRLDPYITVTVNADLLLKRHSFMAGSSLCAATQSGALSDEQCVSCANHSPCSREVPPFQSIVQCPPRLHSVVWQIDI